MKELGQVFTPNFIVKKMLNLSDFNYNFSDIKILEPSFGEGVFLMHIIERIIINGRKMLKTDSQICDILSNNIYGVELDEKVFKKALINIKNLLEKYNLPGNLNLHLYNEDFLDFNKEKDFDYIIGNPPYIRIHNIDSHTRKKIKDYKFSTGNTDLYIIFFEKCINLLEKSGKLIFITPNSYIRNSSQKTFRSFLTENKLINKIIDFGSNKIFANADTYTAITFLEKDNTKTSFIYERNDGLLKLSEKEISFSVNDWFLNNNTSKKLGDICSVQYGFATNADKIFIKDEFENIEKDILKDIVKGSKIDTCKTQKIIFPYKKKDEKYIPFTEEELKNNFPKAYEYLYKYKKELENRSLEKNTPWFCFARSQSIQTVDSKKLVLKHILGDEEYVAYKIVNEDTCVYSGLYITAQDFTSIEKVIKTKQFCTFLKENGKDMSGGYKSFNTKLVKNFNI